LSLEQIQALLEASEPLKFKGRNRKEVYDWVNRTVREVGYQDLPRSARGVVRRYIAKMTGLSRAQTTRMLGQYLQGEEIKPKLYRRHRFTKRYTREDVELLAAIDEAHDTLSGPATQKLLQRACYDFGEKKYQRLARLSVAQLYRLRQSREYRERWIRYEATRPTKVAIGERRRPEPNGRPGFLRVDTVHQGDLDGVKGVYHINAVDEVTQWQVVGATSQISEAFLIPVLEAMLGQFPFRILGFHSDNGSEFINHTIAELLQQVADRTDQIAAATLQRQWTGGGQEWRCGAQTHGVHTHRGAARGGGASVLYKDLQFLSKLSSALWCARTGGQYQRQNQESLPVVCHTVGDPAAVARCCQVPQTGCDHRGSGASGAG